MPSEQQIQKKITDWLTKEGYYVVKVVTASKAGVPDILCCVAGKFVGIEVKKPETKNNVSKLQEYNLDSITNSGGHSIVAWDLEMVQEFIWNEVDK